MEEQLGSIRQTLVAATPAGTPSGATRRVGGALMLCALLFLILLIWSTWEQIAGGLERERSVAALASATAAATLAQRMRRIETQLAGFVHRERGLLSGAVTALDSAERRDDLWALLKAELPEASAGVVLDTRSGGMLTLGEGLKDTDGPYLHQFVRGLAAPMRIGGQGQTLQVDFAAAWYTDGEAAGALLIGVRWAALWRSAGLAVPAGHHLRLRPAGAAPSPGIAADEAGEGAGAADTLLVQLPLSDTGWVLEDRLGAAYTSNLVHNRILIGTGLGAIFLLVALALYRWVRRQDRGKPQERLELREDRIKLQAILSAATDGMILTDSRGRIELFNPAAEMMFGRLTEDVLNGNVDKLLPDFFLPETAAALLGRKAGDRVPPLVRETHGQRKGEGGVFPVRLWLSSVRFDGEPHLLIVVQDLTEHVHDEEHLVFLEQRDVLTGLLNRREFERRLAAILAADRQEAPGPHVLCYVDVDQFKLVNDTCGHEAGDEMLRQLAILFKAKLDETDIAARLGSDEFGALLPNRTVAAAHSVCDGFIQTVRNFLFTWRDQSFDVAVCIGLIEFTPDGEGASSLLSKAGVACQMAKTHGRDRIHIYHERDVKLARHHGDMRLVSTISQALSDGRFQLYAQPIVPIADAGAHRRHFEILVRMVGETGSRMIPDDFIPAAERYILMPAVDRWIINRLFSLQAENLRAWHRSEPDRFLFAVNLSGTSLTDEGFLRYLKRQFADWGVPHRTICFELTETATVRSLERARAFMEELGALGCSFALDDFGTGLSSYRYLRELPVDYLKIDGSFVRGMTEDAVNYALVESINQIGHVLGMKTIAEWAEDEDTLQQLRALNVDFAQGYGVGESIAVCGLTLADALFPLPEAAIHDPQTGI